MDDGKTFALNQKQAEDGVDDQIEEKEDEGDVAPTEMTVHVMTHACKEG